MNKDNVYHYDVTDVYYAPGEKQENGSILFSKPIREYGIQSIEATPEGDSKITRADGIDYLTVNSNKGYTGKIGIIKVSDRFKKDCLGERFDKVTGIQYEDAEAEPRPFALIFSFVGDKRHKRHVMYNNIATRIADKGENKENQKEPDTEEISFTCTPCLMEINGELKQIVKANTTMDSTPEVFKMWHRKVIIPKMDLETDASLKTLTIDATSLTPAFNSDVTKYAAEVSTETSKITATTTDAKATTNIIVNGEPLAADASATWKDGENELVIEVVSAPYKEVYTITVNKVVAV